MRSDVIKVNLGSGTDAARGWINIDKSWNIYLSRFRIFKKVLYQLGLISKETYETDWYGKRVVRWDIANRLPFGDNIVDYVYCSHVLEHMTYQRAKSVCEEVRRILKTGGVYRVVVPDLRLLARKYVQGDKKFFGAELRSNEPISNLFLRSLNLEGLRGRKLVERFFYSEHKWMYDSESLVFLLRKSGFSSVSEYGFREGLCADLQRIEKRSGSVYVEAYGD